VIFDTPVEQRYERALALLGLQVWMLSPAGRPCVTPWTRPFLRTW
jgi:putative AlgH/UPF0301 family transcriptional regulator